MMAIERRSIREDNMLEAYAFYNIFRGIHCKYIDCEVSVREMMNFAAYSVPYVINGALACEIALKAVLDINACKRLQHYIDRLFNAIDNEYKQKIKDKFMVYGLSEDEFTQALRQSSSAFVNWRYYYEKDSVSVPKHFYNLVEAICQTMFSFSERIEVSN